MLMSLMLLAAGDGKADDSFAELPTYDIAGEDEIRRDFDYMKFKPLNDPQLEMHFLVGKDWKAQPIKISPRQLKEDRLAPVDLVRVVSPDKKARISVAYVRVGKKVDLEQWVGAYLKGNHLSAKVWQAGVFSGRKVIDALIEAPGKQKVRMTFSHHADRIVIMAGSCPRDLYPKYARHFGLAAVNLKLAS